LPALAPGTLFTLLTTGYPPTIDIAFQYSGHFTPYLFMGTAVALAAYRSEARSGVRLRAAVAAISVATVLSTVHWGALPLRGVAKGGFTLHSFTPPTEADLKRGRDLTDLAAKIPPDAKFAVSEEELPHVSGRLNVMSLKYDTGHADYLLYGAYSNGASVAERARVAGEYVELARQGDIVLLKRTEPSSASK
jgi:hypothetical protein